MTRAEAPVPMPLTSQCRSHPDADGLSETMHECLPSEARCAYCGVRLDPFPCHGCGRFMTAAEMHEATACDGVLRCEVCR